MNSSAELAQLETLAQVDDLLGRVSKWTSTPSVWTPVQYGQALLRRLEGRLDALRTRLAAPLVAATFGGTGTGKSALVNALVGRECTPSGRQRPTTTRPVLIAHPETSLKPLGLPLDQVDVIHVPSPVLRDLVIIDCPDPDTTEEETQGSNLARLHQLLPYCDALIYVSTQQKYRSGRVVEELAHAAAGCRLLFVQTNADLDVDIREDWRKHLGDRYDIPDMFFIDSLRALKDQQTGQPPDAEFHRLHNLLVTQLGASRRMHVRQANLLELVHGALVRCHVPVQEKHAALLKVETVLEDQRRLMVARMSVTLQKELLSGGHLWERRLLSAVADYWGVSPFSSVLRFYNGFGAWLASAGLFRARTTAQMALIGAVQGARWVASKQQDQQAEKRLDKVRSFGLDDALLQESQLVIGGYVHEAELDPHLLQSGNFDKLRHEAERVEDEFLGDAGRHIDEIIDDLARRNSGLSTRLAFEVPLLVMAAFIFTRAAYNFFWDSFINDRKLFTAEFYIHGAVFLGLLSGCLVMIFAYWLRRGLRSRITELANRLAQSRLSTGLFPDLEQACRDCRFQAEQLQSLTALTRQMCDRIANSGPLGGARQPATREPALRP